MSLSHNLIRKLFVFPMHSFIMPFETIPALISAPVLSAGQSRISTRQALAIAVEPDSESDTRISGFRRAQLTSLLGRIR
jgi:hypothetical protein